MRSKISKKILSETLQETKDKVNDYANKLILSSVVVSETELCEHLDKNNKCRMMCLTRCVEGNKFWK